MTLVRMSIHDILPEWFIEKLCEDFEVEEYDITTINGRIYILKDAEILTVDLFVAKEVSW